MRILTRLPRDLHQRLAELDEGGAPAPAPQAVAQRLMQETVEPPPEASPHRPSRRVGWAVAAAVAGVLVLTVGLALLVDRSPTGRTAVGTDAVGSDTPSVAPTPTGDPSAPWRGFPVDARPRPVVLVGEAVDVPSTGFPDGDSKQAFGNGQVELTLPVPSPPSLVRGYPILQATEALHQLVPAQLSDPAASALRVSSISLTEHPFSTDRGRHSLPAWTFRLQGVSGDFYVLAVAAAGRYPATLGPPTTVGAVDVTAGADGRTLTLSFIERHVSTGPCDSGYSSTLDVSQSSTSVVLAVTVHQDPPSSQQSGIDGGCTLVGQVPPTGPFAPGQADTRTVRLDAPLGARVVVDGSAAPFVVTVR